MFRTVCSRIGPASGLRASPTGCRLEGQHASYFQRLQRTLERRPRNSCGSVQPHRLYGFPDSEKGGEFSVVGFRFSVVGDWWLLVLARSVTVAARWGEISGLIEAGNSRPARLEPRTPGTSRFQDEPQTDRSLSDSNSARNSRYEACTPDSSEICGSQPVSRIRLISHSFLGVPSGLLVSCRISP